MAKTILSKKQQIILNAISSNANICKIFYLTGGTALAEYYLQHRLSEDLDFFSKKEFDPQFISVFFKKNTKKLNIKKIEYQQSFNRNLFFLYIGGEIIKTEFTFFPFSRIEKKNKLFIDSLIDIAVNKIFTIYQKPRARDFIDLYFINKKTGWKISDLIKKAKIKFDWHIDFLQLSSQFLLAKEIKDYPIMIKKINHKIWQNYFIKEAKRLNKKILKI
ncbi:nucleotidyl transferase AbiEii/AbiGii toxin family protein [Patescibacteria group bacterium]|nr:nucleotidyl transferase AbiEii/AbiGii toxin family protein [Patescibacteria group bacterium]MBU1662982.1 nucleotidyl transferase AbiEii/AbiGii toxin family protein [Patescibacteria group bacterium]MBU1933960.1 nucleotidyl transferase AbiEii/AbiGii toxin family protein [Patescibacteria group bacterium]